jgi:exodeoxyribonuclease VII small subunit
MMTETDQSKQAASGDKPDQALSYEAALAALEKIVARLESGETTLDESMQLFQQGMTLAGLCADRLAEIEKKITQLIEQADGTIEEKPFGEGV